MLGMTSNQLHDPNTEPKFSGPINGQLPLASYAMVRVRVLDVNDVEPQFTSKIYKLKAREDLPLGTVIGSVQALDPDLYQGGNVKVSKIPKYSAKLFQQISL